MKDYQLIGEDGKVASLIDLTSEFEEILIEKKFLDSVSKESYTEFYLKYVVGDYYIDMKEIYKKNNIFISMTYPSNLSRGWYIFDEVLRLQNGDELEHFTISKLHPVLERMLLSSVIEPDLFKEYLEAVNDSDFEKKNIYRVPLLVLIYDSLEWKEDDSPS
ncbi:hypothetical protein ADIS_1263 [Lunatimonas lonarensis]|uniref:Uncharacterized protein n=2 Tax=Lunatimonas lonarensis TaxID=1232681 RepID=R7ZVA8_9BACT|nr:hypothetical protein ADIS_1263 [Lunatimonas lonarensis]